MKLNPLGSNRNEVEFGDVTILFSYKTPVACHVAGEGFYRTDKQWSRTTSKHIGQWLRANGSGNATIKPQAYFDNLATQA